MRTVKEIEDVVRRWVEKDGCHLPGFAGAYMLGGIIQLPKNSRFPDYRDVDLIIVSTGGRRPQEENLELNLDGLILEVGFWGMEEHRSAEALLADPMIGPNFAATEILADPQEVLRPLQSAISQSFAERKWVQARCESEKKKTLGFLDQMNRASSSIEVLTHLWDTLNYLSGTLALAALKTPTHRRSLTLMKQILLEQNEPELHEDALRVWGAAAMDRQQVESLLQDAARCFDRAVEVQQTPTPLSFKLKPHLRPYFVEASREMIIEGNHREATFWILGCMAIGCITLLIDSPIEEQQSWQSIWQDALSEFDLDEPSSWSARCQAAEELSGWIFQVSDRIVVENGGIIG